MCWGRWTAGVAIATLALSALVAPAAAASPQYDLWQGQPYHTNPSAFVEVPVNDILELNASNPLEHAVVFVVHTTIGGAASEHPVEVPAYSYRNDVFLDIDGVHTPGTTIVVLLETTSGTGLGYADLPSFTVSSTVRSGGTTIGIGGTIFQQAGVQALGDIASITVNFRDLNGGSSMLARPQIYSILLGADEEIPGDIMDPRLVELREDTSLGSPATGQVTAEVQMTGDAGKIAILTPSMYACDCMPALRPLYVTGYDKLDVPSAVERLSGAGRYHTSAAISRDTFSPGVPVAYIANGMNFPDALSGAAAAGFEGGPVLLTATAEIPQVIKDELTRLQPAKIVVLGGKGAVSDALIPTLQSYIVGSGTVERLSGPGRFDTSAAISAATFAPGVPIAYVANGMNFPDALSGGPAAGYTGGPVLLVTPTEIPAAIREELERLNPQKIFVLGGKGAVSLDVLKELGTFVPSTSAVSVPSEATSDDGTVRTYDTTAEPITAWWGDSITVTAAPGFFTTGPDGDWTGDRGFEYSFIRENMCPIGDTEGFGFQEGPQSTTVSPDGSTLTFELPDQPFMEAVWNLARTPSITIVGYAQAPASPPFPCQLTGERFEVVIDLDMAAGRLSGQGRYDTSAVISAETFTPPVDVVYIANGLTFPDALSAAPAGGVNAGPVLLTDKAALPQATKDELTRLQPRSIRVLGGTGAVSAAVMAELEEYVVVSADQ
ncbi:cell wall-binding repeat-containing protein [Microbacterium aoyamense]|uniref:cell wall-binding repeat-containing protein n=1 Tax=Microbacterium aoyamense TaxID=344166 RepID=UPI002006852A|nr:cell wall-binding repeat-containing protein [Microbacterium aoyamense]